MQYLIVAGVLSIMTLYGLIIARCFKEAGMAMSFSKCEVTLRRRNTLLRLKRPRTLRKISFGLHLVKIRSQSLKPGRRRKELRFYPAIT